MIPAWNFEDTLYRNVFIHMTDKQKRYLSLLRLRLTASSGSSIGVSPITDTASSIGVQFSSRWLLIARLLWLILLGVCVGILLVGVTGLYTGWYPWSLSCNLKPPDEQAACLAAQQALHQFGLPLIFPALYFSAMGHQDELCLR